MPGRLPVTIRSCAPEDIAAVAAIYRHAVLHGTASFELSPPDEAEMAARHTKLAADGYPFLVASLENEIVGYAYASAYRARPAYGATVEDSVYIHERMQGRGIGRALLARLIGDCETSGFRQMIAIIGDSANRASFRLHESLGFALVGTFRDIGWKHERWLDTVLMQRALGRGASLPRNK